MKSNTVVSDSERPNIFLNSYQPTENRLTYNLLCLIDNMPAQSDFLKFLCQNRLTLRVPPLLGLRAVMGGSTANPDGRLDLNTDKGPCHLFLENKNRAPLDRAQLERHLKEHCQKKNSHLLIITPREADRSVALSVNRDKVIFHTWPDIVAKLRELNSKGPHFLTSQFLDYGEKKREFIDLQLTYEVAQSYIVSAMSRSDVTPGMDETLRYFFKSAGAAGARTVSESLPFNNLRAKVVDNSGEGRGGLEFNYDGPDECNSWFFFGIYYDPTDHGIPFKTGEPELAFFFDIDPAFRKRLEKNASDAFKKSLGRLEDLGFQENFTKSLTENPWRLLCHRTPISKALPLMPESFVERLTEILRMISDEKQFMGTVVPAGNC